jgi:hypothetical protein
MVDWTVIRNPQLGPGFQNGIFFFWDQVLSMVLPQLSPLRGANWLDAHRLCFWQYLFLVSGGVTDIEARFDGLQTA